MNKKDQNAQQFVDFKDVTPEMRMDIAEPDELYKEAFLSSEEKSNSEFAQNTTVWD